MIMYRYHIIFRVMAVISLRSIVGFPEGRSVRSVISVIKLCHVSSRPPTLPNRVSIGPTFQFPSILTCASFKFGEKREKSNFEAFDESFSRFESRFAGKYFQIFPRTIQLRRNNK